MPVARALSHSLMSRVIRNKQVIYALSDWASILTQNVSIPHDTLSLSCKATSTSHFRPELPTT